MSPDRIYRRSLEEVVLERLRRESERRPVWAPPSGVIRAVRGKLGDSVLSASQRSKLGPDPGDANNERLQDVLAERVREAFLAGWSEDRPAPDFQVLCLTDHASGAAVANFARQLKAQLVAPPAAGVWVLADSSVLRRLEAHLSSDAHHPLLTRDFVSNEPIGQRVLLERSATPLAPRLPRLARLAATSAASAPERGGPRGAGPHARRSPDRTSSDADAGTADAGTGYAGTGPAGTGGASSRPTPAVTGSAQPRHAETPAHKPLSRGAVFAGRYRVERVLEPREFGEIYLVRSLGAEGDSPLQLALIPAERLERRADTALEFDELVMRRMELQHPATLTWRDGGFHDGRAFMVREDFPGVSLSTKLAEDTALRPQHAARILREVLGALEAAHRPFNGEALLHGDLKPERILLSARSAMRGDGPLRVRAFGLARVLGAAPAADLHGARRIAGEQLDAQRVELDPAVDFFPNGPEGQRVTCTPSYASPEQARLALGQSHDPLTPASDLFSAGALAFRMLTGHAPAEPSSSGAETLDRRAAGEVLRIGSRQRATPARLAAIVDRLLSPNPIDRYRDAGEALADLDAFLAPSSVGPAIKLAVPLVGVAAVALGWAVVHAEGDVGYALDSTDLTFGPQRPRLELRLTREDGREVDTNSSPRLVDLEGTPFSEWRASWTPEGKLQLEAHWNWASGEVERDAQLQLGGRVVGNPFRLTWIGSEAWSLCAPRVHGTSIAELGGRSVDLDGLTLEFALEGPGFEHVESVGLEIDGETRPLIPLPGTPVARATDGSAPATEAAAATPEGAPRAPQPTDLSGLRFRIEPDAPLLEQLRRDPAARQLALVAEDSTGRQQRLPLDFRTTPEPLAGPNKARLVDLALAGADGAPECQNAAADAYFLLPRNQPALELPLTGSARIDVRYLLDGAAIPGPTSTLATGAALALSGIEALGEGTPFRAMVAWEADDSEFVLRGQPELRGRASGRIAFDWSASEAAIETRLSYGAGESVWLDDAGRWVANERRVALEVGRLSGVPMWIEVLVLSSDAPEGAPPLARLESAELRNLSAGSTRFELELPRDGRFTVEVRSHQYSSPTGSPVEHPDANLQLALHVDTAAPQLEFAGLEREGVYGSGQAPELHLDLALLDEGTAAASVVVDWLLQRAGDEAAYREGTLGGPAADARWRPAPGGQLSADLELLAPWAPGSAAEDGEWRLELQARDLAGNLSPRLRVPFTVAARGPLLEAFEPQPQHTWLPRVESAGWALRFSASDPNGVSEVRARLTAPGVDPVEILLAERVAGSTMFEGELDLPYAWSELVAELLVLGTDERGAVRNLRLAEIQLPAIVPRRPSGVSALGGRAVEPMRLIPGNSTGAYVFGGRDDRVENELFARADLPLFNPDVRSLPPRAWKLEYAAGQIGDYYLDEREVTRAKFLQFVEHGWSDARHWPAGSAAPSATRRQEFLARLSGAEGTNPITGVSWEEASAYASWVGKRLPSWVEWEYAVRGGTLYRPFAGWDEVLDLEFSDEVFQVNAGWSLAERPDSPWDPVRLDDAVAGGVRALSGNLSEWTATPAWFGDSTGTQPRLHALQHRAELLDPTLDPSASGQPSFWVAGASFSDRRFDFSVADVRGRRERTGGIGFRCALSLDEYRRSETAYNGESPAGEESSN